MYSVSVLFVAIVTIGYVENVVYRCTTPDEESAYCVSLFSCPGLMKSLSTLNSSAISYFKRSRCYGCQVEGFMVCCGRSNIATPRKVLHSTVTKMPLNPTVNKMPLDPTVNNMPLNPTVNKMPFDPSVNKMPLDPSVNKMPLDPTANKMPQSVAESTHDRALRTLIPDRKYCGLQHTDDRYFNSPFTALDEFPWLVHIKFTDIHSAYKFGDRCTGVLINQRYVLSDAVCAGPAIKVRLGQYNVAHRVTCIENPEAHECNERTIEIRIAKKISLNSGAPEFYAITLIRLAQEVDYSDFVRPICLPLRESDRPPLPYPLTFSGWGANPTSRVIEDAIKKRLDYQMMEVVECKKLDWYLQTLSTENLTSFNCFSPYSFNTDMACRGDHGGPLMYSDDHRQWFVDYVVVKVVFDECSKINPVIAMKITPTIIDRILENMEP